MFSAYPLNRLKDLRDRKGRYEAQEYLSEGVKSVDEALDARGRVAVIIIDESRVEEPAIAAIEAKAKQKRTPIEYLKKEQYKQISTTATPAGVLCVLPMPRYALDNFSLGPIVALAGIADPGNMGTIIRTADWFGFSNLLISSDSVDPYNEKVVRSTMGSLQRVTIVQTEEMVASLEQLRKKGYTVASCTLQGTPLSTFEPPKNTVLVFGSESHGLPPVIRSCTDTFLTIPGAGDTESLNVAIAAGIAMHHLYSRVA